MGILHQKLGLMLYTVVVNGTTIYEGSKEDCQSIALNLQVAGVPYCGMHVNRNSKITAFEARLE